MNSRAAKLFIATIAAIALALGLVSIPTAAQADSYPIPKCDPGSYRTGVASLNGRDCISQFGYTGASVDGAPVDAYGNNCTNYVAFREKENHPSFSFSGEPNAQDWWTWAPKKFGVSEGPTPHVGDAAVWSGAEAGNSMGHIAYVEWVSSDGSTIEISESSYGDFVSNGVLYPSWSGVEVISKTSRGWTDRWPSALGFIYFSGGTTTPSSAPPSAPVPASASPQLFTTLGAANIRTGTSTATSVVTTVSKGTHLTIDCYLNGQNVNGNGLWDHVPALAGYISDTLLYTGSNNPVVPLCQSSSSSGQLTWANAGVYRLPSDYKSSTFGTLVAGPYGSGTGISIECWMDGKGMPATTSGGTAYTDYVWYFLPNVPGWISDAGVRTTTDNATTGQFGPQCPLGTIQGSFPVIGGTTVFASPSLTAQPVGSVSVGDEEQSIDCTATGDSVTNSAGTGQTSTLWDHINGWGYIPDVDLLTGSNAPVIAATCDVASVPVDETAVQSAQPTVSGTTTPGQTLTADTTGWASGTSFLYQWNADGTAISGAESSTFTPTASQAGQTLSVSVTGATEGYLPTTQTSADTSTILPSLTTAAPKISGTVGVGHTLTVTTAGWTSGTSFAYQWFTETATRHTTTSKGKTTYTYSDATPIDGAISSTFVVPVSFYSSDSSETTRMLVQVVGSKAGYTTSAPRVSALTVSPVTGTLSGIKPLIIANRPAAGGSVNPVAASAVKAGDILSVTTGTWGDFLHPISDGGDSNITYSYQWYESGVAISGAKSATYAIPGGYLGRTINVRVAGSLAGFSNLTEASASTGKVASGSFVGSFTFQDTGNGDGTETIAPVPTGFPANAKFTYTWVYGPFSRTSSTLVSIPVPAQDDSFTVKIAVSAVGFNGNKAASYATTAVAKWEAPGSPSGIL